MFVAPVPKLYQTRINILHGKLLLVYEYNQTFNKNTINPVLNEARQSLKYLFQNLGFSMDNDFKEIIESFYQKYEHECLDEDNLEALELATEIIIKIITRGYYPPPHKKSTLPQFIL